MASESGPISQAILGSIPQDVLLLAKCPVLVFHDPKLVRQHSSKSRRSRKHVAETASVQVTH